MIFDCPGQIELYTHLPIMRQLVEQLEKWNFRTCAVFLLDSQFLLDSSKFFSGVLAALSVMVTLEIPHVNIMSKVDLLNKEEKENLEKYVTFFRNSKNHSMLSCTFFVLVFSYLDPDLVFLNEDFRSSRHRKKFEKLNRSIAKVIQDYSLVKFHPLDISDEDSIKDIVLIIDNMIQYGEDLGIKASSNIWVQPFFW